MWKVTPELRLEKSVLYLLQVAKELSLELEHYNKMKNDSTLIQAIESKKCINICRQYA